MQNIIDIKLIKFILIGVLNTIFSAFIMFGLYNKLHLGYWGASSIAYILASILSFFLNKNFTFKSHGTVAKTGVKFAINIAVCYLISYSIAQPSVTLLLARFNLKSSSIEQISMLFGMVLFTGLNYLGQRFFAFKE